MGSFSLSAQAFLLSPTPVLSPQTEEAELVCISLFFAVLRPLQSLLANLRS